MPFKSVETFLDNNPWDDSIYQKFLLKFKPVLVKTDSSNIFITSKLLTTITDNFDSLKKFGLINLRMVLERDTSLHNFFIQNNIDFDFDKNVIAINVNPIKLFYCGEICSLCENVSNSCKNYSDEVKSAIHQIFVRIYMHNAELEVFIGRTHKEYSCVDRHPEIVMRVNNLLNALEEFPYNYLANAYEKISQSQNYSLLEFDVAINSFENLLKISKNNYYFISEYVDFYGYTESFVQDNDIPDSVFLNSFLLKNSIDTFYDPESNEEFGELYPDIVIPYSDIRIHHLD